jgi:hypothetical protein
LEKITFSHNDQKQLVQVLTGSNFKQFISDENNYNIVLNYLRKIIKQNSLSGYQNKNLNNSYILFLSLSDKKENKQEIIDYLKGPFNVYTLNKNHMNVSFTNKKVIIDLSFAEKILKNNPPALALIYFLMHKYEASIKMALDNKEYELSIFLAQNIKNKEKQKKIWIKLFNFYKNNKIYSPKNLLELSNGIINIEDILPYMDDEIKLSDIKIDLQECIDVYEANISELKHKISSFSNSNNNIQEEIYAINRRKINIEHSKIKCKICQNIINENNKFFLFPCGHVFDADCIVKILMDYDSNNIGGEDFKGKVKAVRNLSEKIFKMQNKKVVTKKNVFVGLSDFGKKTRKSLINFINFVQRGKKTEKTEVEEDITTLSNEEEMQLRELSKGLYNIIKEECILCGKEMINSIQVKFSQEDENKKWENLV